MLRTLGNAGWILTFVVFCALFGREVLRATRQAPAPGGAAWICPILGQCGPPGTPGLGRW